MPDTSKASTRLNAPLMRQAQAAAKASNRTLSSWLRELVRLAVRGEASIPRRETYYDHEKDGNALD